MQPGPRQSAARRYRQAAHRALAAACLGFGALALPVMSEPVEGAPPDAAPADAVPADAVPVEAAPLPRGVQRWPIVAAEGPLELSGVAPATEFTFDLPPSWQPGADGVLYLDYEVPALVEFAAIGISLNGAFVDAVALGLPAGSASVALPADGFRSGTNTVRVEATIGVLDDRECPDPWHPARVVTFGASSRVEVPLVPADRLDLDDLPAALEPVGIDDRVLTVRLGPEPTAEDLSAAAIVVAAVRGSADLDVLLEVDTLASAGRATGPDVVIGVADDLTAAGIELPDADGGLLRIGRNSADEARLVVSGSTPTHVLAAARSIGNAPSTSLVLGIEPDGEPSPPPATARFTLGDLGYPDRDLTGPGVAATLYGFDAPLSHTPTSMALTVDAVRSASGDEVSGLSVFVNGSRVGTVHFDVDTGATSGVQINVSGDDVRPGRNFLRIEAEFHGPPHHCDQRPPEELVEVSSDTLIELVTNEASVTVDLEDLPYLFRSPTDSTDLVVVLPDDPSRRDLADAIDIAATYGDDEFPAEIARAGTIGPDELRGAHLIVLGEPDAQPVHDLIDDSIVDSEEDAVDADVVESFTRLNGVIEVVPNPADPTRAIMLATGFDAAGADLAQAVLLEPLLRGELYGRATFVGGIASDPVLAPVLEPVRIERGDIGGVSVEDREVDPVPAGAADESDDGAGFVDDGAAFEFEAAAERTSLAGLPLNLVGLIVLVALTIAGGIGYAIHRRRAATT